MIDGHKAYYDARKLKIEFYNFVVYLESSLSTKYVNTESSENIKSIDLIKIDNDKFIFECIKNGRWQTSNCRLNYCF
jgi:hypothetical protein